MESRCGAGSEFTDAAVGRGLLIASSAPKRCQRPRMQARSIFAGARRVPRSLGASSSKQSHYPAWSNPSPQVRSLPAAGRSYRREIPVHLPDRAKEITPGDQPTPLPGMMAGSQDGLPQAAKGARNDLAPSACPSLSHQIHWNEITGSRQI